MVCFSRICKSSRGFSPETSTLGFGTLNPPLSEQNLVEKGRAPFLTSLAYQTADVPLRGTPLWDPRSAPSKS